LEESELAPRVSPLLPDWAVSELDASTARTAAESNQTRIGRQLKALRPVTA
jgi:hypothetical protein